MEQEQATQRGKLHNINANNGRISMNNQSSACSNSSSNNTIDSYDMHLNKRDVSR